MQLLMVSTKCSTDEADASTESAGEVEKDKQTAVCRSHSKSVDLQSQLGALLKENERLRPMAVAVAELEARLTALKLAHEREVSELRAEIDALRAEDLDIGRPMLVPKVQYTTFVEPRQGDGNENIQLSAHPHPPAKPSMGRFRAGVFRRRASSTKSPACVASVEATPEGSPRVTRRRQLPAPPLQSEKSTEVDAEAALGSLPAFPDPVPPIRRQPDQSIGEWL